MSTATATRLRLNLGCGEFYATGWVNIDNFKDQRPGCKVDKEADFTDLSGHYAAGSIEEIYAGHILEHVDADQTRRVLSHWKDLLRVGGRITVVVPDVVRSLGLLAIGQLEMDIQGVIYGDPIGAHRQAFWEQRLLKEMRAVFGNADIVDGHAIMPARVNWQVAAMSIRTT